jgi:hypothetical protein
MSQTPSITGAQWRVSTLGVGCHNWIWAAAIMEPLYFCARCPPDTWTCTDGWTLFNHHPPEHIFITEISVTSHWRAYQSIRVWGFCSINIEGEKKTAQLIIQLKAKFGNLIIKINSMNDNAMK